MFGYEQPISQQQAQRLLNKPLSYFESRVKVEDRKQSAINVDGIECQLGWENENSVVIHHFWIDEKIRNSGIGSTILEEVLTQIEGMERIEYVSATVQTSDGQTKAVMDKFGFDWVTVEHSEYGELVEGEKQID